MVRQWTLATRGKPSEIIDVSVGKKQNRKKLADIPIENELKKSQLECAMLKLQLKDITQQLLSLEIEREHQKHEIELMQAKSAHSASLACLASVLIHGIKAHGSKWAQKRIHTNVLQQCPEIILEKLQSLLPA